MAQARYKAWFQWALLPHMETCCPGDTGLAMADATSVADSKIISYTNTWLWKKTDNENYVHV